MYHSFIYLYLNREARSVVKQFILLAGINISVFQWENARFFLILKPRQMFIITIKKDNLKKW